MGRKSKAQLAAEANEKSLQELADTACDVADKKKINIDSSGRFVKGNKASSSEAYFDNLDKVVDVSSSDSLNKKEEVTKIFQEAVPYAAKQLVKKMRSNKTPLKERNDIAELIITALYGKAPLDNNVDNTIHVILSDESKVFAE